MKKRAAVCISGHCRNWQDNTDIWLNHFTELNKYCDVDYFLVTGITNDSTDGVRASNGKQLPLSKCPYQNMIDHFQPKLSTFVCDYTYELHERWNAVRYRSLGQSTMSMWHKIWLCNELKNSWEHINNFQYDYVVRTRPDIKLHTYVVLANYMCDNYSIYTEDDHLEENWFSDKFAIMNSTVADRYASLYKNIDIAIKASNCFHSELMLGNYLKKVHFITNHKCLHVEL
jgi:hypothetical protein